MADIFISYSRRDSEQALALAERLEADDFNVWLDRHGIDGAEQWATEIVEGIRGCSTFLLLLSPSSVESANVLKELSLASERGKRILPVRIAPVVLPSSFEYQIAGIQHVAITDYDAIIRSHQRGVARKSSVDLRKSLIILPFGDLSPQKDNEWFADGLTGELIGALSTLKSLRVLDHKSSMELRGVKQSTREIAQTYDTRYVVEGTVTKFGERIKIAASLIDIETYEHLWQDSYKGVMDDIFDLQETVTQKIVDGLKVHLSATEKKKVRERGTENAEAYELWMKADAYYSRHTKPDYERAVSLYEEAVRLDPTFANAYADLSLTYRVLYRYYRESTSLLDRAETAAEKVHELEGPTPQYLCAMSRIYLSRDDYEGALRFAERSIATDPTFSVGYDVLAFALQALQRPEDAVNAREEYVRLRENDTQGHFNYLTYIKELGTSPEIIERLRIAADKAIPVFQRHLRFNPDHYHEMVNLANIYSMAGREAEAIAEADKLSAIESLDAASLYNLACTYLLSHQPQRGMATLVRCVRSGFRHIEIFKVDPDLDPIREMPEFIELMHELEEHKEHHG